MPSFDGLPGGGRNVEQFFNAVVGEGCDCVIVADVGANDSSADQVVVAGDDRFAQLGILALPRTVTSGSGNIGLERPIWRRIATPEIQRGKGQQEAAVRCLSTNPGMVALYHPGEDLRSWARPINTVEHCLAME